MNPWAPIILPSPPTMPLRQRGQQLLAQQRASWELFGNGEAALSGIISKQLMIDGISVVVQANPGRSISTNAKVDARSVADRPCFLCPGSLPPEERGVAFGDYIVLPNPYPVLKSHFTIAFCHHEPQQVGTRLHALCAIAKELGPDLFVLYNGPRCGASAPDHQHFQACSAEGVPLFMQLPDKGSTDTIVPLTLGGRRLLSGNFATTDSTIEFLASVLSNLQSLSNRDDEPMLNLIVRFCYDRFSVAVFPRAKHRSACYFAEPSQRLSISPAAIEMAGVIVVADLDHFDRVDAEAVAAIYREVTLDAYSFSRLTEMTT